MNSNLRSLLGALQQRADLAVLKPLITPETAKAKDIFYGLLPLFWALSYGAPAEVLRALLDAYPAAAEEKHPQGWTPLHYAEKLDAEALKLLLARCPKTASREVDNEGALPLHWVAEHDAPKEVVELLLEAYPEGLSKRDGRGRVPAQLAMEASLEVKQLLEAANPRAFRRMPAPEPIAVIVPGLPGNEYVGMLKDVEELPYIKDLLSQAKTLLGLDLVKVSSTSPVNLEELPCQHALMYVSGVAAVQRLQKMEKCPAGNFQVLAGLSVGEYVALAIAGVFSFDDGLRLVLQRAKVLARSTDQAFSSLSSAARVLAAFHIATSKMAFASKMIACGLLMLALSSVQSFVPAVFGQHEAPSRGVSSSVAAPIEQATSNMESSPSMMPLALGLSVGLALALPQSALAASSGNEDVGTLIDRLFTKEALGAFGIAGLSWNVFYLLFGLSGAGVILFAVVLSIALPPAKTMADVKKK